MLDNVATAEVFVNFNLALTPPVVAHFTPPKWRYGYLVLAIPLRTWIAKILITTHCYELRSVSVIQLCDATSLFSSRSKSFRIWVCICLLHADGQSPSALCAIVQNYVGMQIGNVVCS